MAEESREEIFTRTEYRRVIAWKERIRRESPFLREVLGEAGGRRVLDVGCGTGEHTRHLAEQGWQAVGIDLSEDMIENAATLAGAIEGAGSARYERCVAAEAGGLPDAPFDAAICLGNMFAFAEDGRELDSWLRGIAAALRSGGTFLLQILNYERILASAIRYLPVNFRPLSEEEGDGEIVFLRILTPRPDGDLDFYPVTLTLRPGADPPVEIRSARQGKHRPWKRSEMEAALERAGFRVDRIWGGMSEVPFVPEESYDLTLAAVKV
jgi:SAM-dependent methyltransferase